MKRIHNILQTYQLVNEVMVVTGDQDVYQYVVDGKYSVQDDTFIFLCSVYQDVAKKMNQRR